MSKDSLSLNVLIQFVPIFIVGKLSFTTSMSLCKNVIWAWVGFICFFISPSSVNKLLSGPTNHSGASVLIALPFLYYNLFFFHHIFNHFFMFFELRLQHFNAHWSDMFILSSVLALIDVVLVEVGWQRRNTSCGQLRVSWQLAVMKKRTKPLCTSFEDKQWAGKRMPSIHFLYPLHPVQGRGGLEPAPAVRKKNVAGQNIMTSLTIFSASLGFIIPVEGGCRVKLHPVKDIH